MKKTFFKGVILTAAFTAAVATLLIFLIPKTILIDRFLSERGIFLLAEGVKEGVFSIELSSASVYYRNKKVVSFDRLRVRPLLGGLHLKGDCGKGYLGVLLSWGGDIEVNSEAFTCVEGVGEIKADLKITDLIKGKAKLKDIDTGIVTVDSVELLFKGKEFEGKVVYGKFEFVGRGRVKINRKDPMSSTVSAEFTGPVGKVVLRGTLANPRIQTP
jgi:hypothetical protein